MQFDRQIPTRTIELDYLFLLSNKTTSNDFSQVNEHALNKKPPMNLI